VKILILSPYPILPPLHGGRVRTARLAEGLARAGASVDLLCPWYPGQPRSGRLADAFTCHSHLLASNLLPWAAAWLAAPLALLSFQPPPRKLLRTFANSDIFQFDFCAHAGWMKLVPEGAKIVYSAHNVERDFCQNDSARYLLARASLSRIERLERLAVERSDLVVTCTEKDATRLREHYGAIGRTAVVPNGCPAALLDLDRDRLSASSRAALGIRPDQRAILFVGGNASHNRQAVEFLLSAVLPQLDRNAVLLVVGKCGRAGWNSADSRARFFGFVADLRPFLAAADVAVNPVDRDSGSSVKLVEYLAAGLPVVSTPIGARGLGDQLGGVRIVPREQFAEHLRGPLTALTADRAALARLTWEHLGETLLREYERLCAS
jgi:glycosyltransferase involved in cell wall biosynthesis